MNDKILDLAKKLQALAERGVGGEKTNAASALERLMKKHGLDIADLESEDLDTRFINVEKKDHALFAQVASTVLGAKISYWSHYESSHRMVGMKCTAADWLEIEAKYRFYKALLKKEYDAFYYAFIMANNIFPKPSEKDEEREANDMTDEERKAYEKARRLASRMDTHHFFKQIDG